MLTNFTTYRFDVDVVSNALMTSARIQTKTTVYDIIYYENFYNINRTLYSCSCIIEFIACVVRKR